METALPSLHALAAPSDEALLEERSQIARREGTFRGVLARATCAVVFLACSLMVLSLLPFYPPAMAVFLGIICGALAYRWPSGALAMLLVLAAPAYSYQLGGIVWGLLAMIAVAAALPFALSRLPGAAVGCAVGAAAGALMLTPYFFLALPLLAGVTLLRLKGSSSAGGWGLFMFLIIYVPFLFLAEVPKEPGATVPLFATVEYARQLPLNQLDLESLKAAFQGLMSNDISGFPGFSSYFVRGWGGVVLLLTMLVAILVNPAVLNLRKRVGMRRILFR